jgi:sugar lactone lactonase YvrE
MDSYSWSEEWDDTSADESAMSHTSVVITGAGEIVVGAPAEATLVVRDASGEVIRKTTVEGVIELHGMTPVTEDGEELLWIADTGTSLYGGSDSLDIRHVSPEGQVVQVDLDGNQRRKLDRPPLDVYDGDARYSPTAVAVADDGTIWVADGYGAGLVHRFAADGSYLGHISGEEGAGPFKEPHDVLIDTRGDTPELYVADRVNGRLQIFDLDGSFLRTAGEGFLPGPTQLAIDGDRLLVTDLLTGRLSILDADDELVEHLFEHPSPPPAWDNSTHPDGWPNARGDDGLIVAVDLQPEQFHTPHGVAVADDGTIYVSEFAIGERVAVLRPT